MNTFLETLNKVCTSILPLLGAIAIIIAIVLLIELIKTVKSANTVLKKGTGTIDLVDESIKKVQAPLDTAVKVSETIDKAHDETIKRIDDAKEYLGKNAKTIKEKIVKLTNVNSKDVKKIVESDSNDVL